MMNKINFKIVPLALMFFSIGISAQQTNVASKEEKVAKISEAQASSTTSTGNYSKGRVGINTDEPKATLDVRETALERLPKGTPQGVSFPNFTTEQRDTFNKSKLKEGTMIFNTTLKCLEFYNGTEWKCIQIKP